MSGATAPVEAAAIEAQLAPEDGWSELPRYAGPTEGAVFVPGHLRGDAKALFLKMERHHAERVIGHLH